MGELKSLKDFQGYTPLHLAAENGPFDECKRLVRDAARFSSPGGLAVMWWA